MQSAAAYEAPPDRLLAWRRRQDILLAAAMGGVLALLVVALPLSVALASAVVGAFIILALVDTRVALLALLLVRATIDVTATVPLLSATGGTEVNAAAMMTFLLVGLGVVHIGLQRIDVWRIPLSRPFAAFLALTFVGIPLAPSPATAFEDWMRIAGSFALYIIAVDLMRTRQDLQWMIRVIVLSAVVPLAVGLYQAATGAGNTDTPGITRIMGTFTHPSPYASYLVQLLPIAVVLYLHTQVRIARVGLVVLIPAMIFSIYATQTRVAWIGLVVVAMVFMATRARWTLLLVPLAAGALFFAMPSVQARFDEATSSTGSVFWRQRQWERAIETASPIELAGVGSGLGAVDARLGNLAHNEYVRLLVETGAVGLVLMAVLYARLLSITMRGYRSAPTPADRDLMLAMLMAFTARVVIAASDNLLAFPVLEWYFWAFAAVIVVKSGAYERKRGALPIQVALREAGARP